MYNNYPQGKIIIILYYIIVSTHEVTVNTKLYEYGHEHIKIRKKEMK